MRVDDLSPRPDSVKVSFNFYELNASSKSCHAFLGPYNSGPPHSWTIKLDADRKKKKKKKKIHVKQYH